MSQHSSSRVRHWVERWFTRRIEECVHCSDCGHAVTPWTSRCQHCGQANPAKVSLSAAVVLAIGFVLLATIGSYLVVAL
jgi:uncharacterized OB-fold protein